MDADILDDLMEILSDWDDVVWNGVTYKGIFFNPYEAASLFENSVESRNPYVEVKESDFSAISHSDIVTIGGVVYHVIGVEPSETGLLILRLSKD